MKIDNIDKILILVVTEQFPAINQTWIDVYIEHILINLFDVNIYTANKKYGFYSSKIIEMNMMDYVVGFDLNFRSVFFKILQSTLFSPVQLVISLKCALKIVDRLIIQYNLKRWSSFFKLLRFDDGQLSKADLIHSHGEILAFEFMFLARMHNKPLVYTFHGLTPKGVNPLSASKRRALYGEVDLVLVNTEFSKRQVMGIGCPAEKVVILPQGLPIEEFIFSPLPCPKGSEILHILSVGRFHRDKGHGYSLLAVTRLKKAGVHFHFHIVGVGPGKGRMLRMIQRFNLTGYVTLYEALETEALHSLYRSSHLFILASVANDHGEHVETQGVVLQEAQASGCIPIATQVGGIPECVNDKEDAILVRDRSSRAICEAVQYLLARPEEWRKYQENGRRNVEENFSADVIGRKMATILRSVVAQKSELEQE